MRMRSGAFVVETERAVKRTDPFYLSREWRAVRAAALARDGGRCVVPGCQQNAVVVDHIVARQQGGAALDLTNLRSLCRAHDNQVKERNGIRRANGRLPPAFDLNGYPITTGQGV